MDNEDPSIAKYSYPDRRVNYVDSYPVTAVRHGLNSFGPKVWNEKPCNLVISGVNYNWNTGWDARQSGTANIAMYVARRGIPAIAISARNGARDENRQQGRLYAQLVVQLVNTLIRSDGICIPTGIWLSVHLPGIEKRLPEARDFRWVLSRIDPDHCPIYSKAELQPENDKSLDKSDIDNLPTEQTVLMKGFDRISLSINRGLGDASREEKAEMKKNLGDLLACNQPSQGGNIQELVPQAS